MKTTLLVLLLLGAVVVAAPTAAASHRICEITDAPCMAFCLGEAVVFRHPCSIEALDPCEIVCVLP